MTAAFRQFCLSVLFSFTAVSPIPCHYSFRFTPWHLCCLSPYLSSARSIYIVPFTFSWLSYIYSVLATTF
ncbi:hypothetical protein ARMGADRAFT_1021656 [Armillaria gallica]|uniref:Uncharacterized protein n=1 Tax=Armillaria gallica TaxID=47427 RepID=A0A2H3CBF9_ARMGA|nr:hypothetical protein ARMGADRAFT_1021656 [Armillaria gallica]